MSASAANSTISEKGTPPKADELTTTDYARAYDAWFDKPWGSHAWAVERAAVTAALSGRSAGFVVEVGCGTGRLVEFLARRGHRVLGIDIAAEMLAVAATRVPGRLVRADVLRLPLPDAVADVAIALATLEFTDATTALAELARITRPGGRVVVLALNPRSPWGLLDRPRLRTPYSAATFLTRRRLRRLGRRYGRITLRGTLFTAARPGLLHHLEALAAVLGHGVPWLGAVQVLVIDKAARDGPGISG
ncbi:MAG: class I SAM-dependent methyltransferase [Mycobacterium sp.]|nr:class I SAM-dependent methyltransferase [Mycobacterium sp.]